MKMAEHVHTTPLSQPPYALRRLGVLGLLVLLALAVASCSDDEAEQAVEVQAYFPSSNSTSVALTADETTFTVTVWRLSGDGAATIALSSTQTVTDEDSNSTTVSDATSTDSSATRADSSAPFSIPTSVSFLSGVQAGDVVIAFDPDLLGYDREVEITLTLDAADTAPYHESSFSFVACMSTPWNSLGNCTFTEDFMYTFYRLSPPTYEVELQESGVTDGHFRLVNPFGAAYPYNTAGDWDDSQDWYLEVHAEDPDGVYIPLQQTGMDWGYGNVVVGSLGAYYMDNGYTLEAVKALGLAGTYADGQITFPYRSLVVHMPDYDDQYYYANYNSAFCIVVPTVDQVDASQAKAGVR